MNQIKEIAVEELHFDKRNPRLIEFAGLQTEEKIIETLWNNMAVNEIVMSILANGFFKTEALYVVKEEGKYVVIEGNRRLAAVKSILCPDVYRGMSKYASKITLEIKKSLAEIPVIVLEGREDAWRYIGFKHVNGPVKWDSYAKAEYIAQVHNDYGIELEDIAEQIGDSNKTTIKLYQGLMILKQADSETDFKISDVYYKRVYFSHIYTAIMYEGFQRYLNIDITKHCNNPVPESNLKNLEQVMLWIFGSKGKDIKPVINSQNPDIRRLNQVLTNQTAIQALINTGDLARAYDMSQEGRDLLRKSIVEAQMSIQDALSKVGFYDGDDELLNAVISVANSADGLYSSMKEIRRKKLGKEEKRTID